MLDKTYKATIERLILDNLGDVTLTVPTDNDINVDFKSEIIHQTQKIISKIEDKNYNRIILGMDYAVSDMDFARVSGDDFGEIVSAYLLDTKTHDTGNWLRVNDSTIGEIYFYLTEGNLYQIDIYTKLPAGTTSWLKCDLYDHLNNIVFSKMMYYTEITDGGWTSVIIDTGVKIETSGYSDIFKFTLTEENRGSNPIGIDVGKTVDLLPLFTENFDSRNLDDTPDLFGWDYFATVLSANMFTKVSNIQFNSSPYSLYQADFLGGQYSYFGTPSIISYSPLLNSINFKMRVYINNADQTQYTHNLRFEDNSGNVLVDIDLDWKYTAPATHKWGITHDAQSTGLIYDIDTWYDIRFVWNNATQKISMYIDSVLLGTFTDHNYDLGGIVDKFYSESYDLNLNGYGIFFDDFKYEYISPVSDFLAYRTYTKQKSRAIGKINKTTVRFNIYAKDKKKGIYPEGYEGSSTNIPVFLGKDDIIIQFAKRLRELIWNNRETFRLNDLRQTVLGQGNTSENIEYANAIIDLLVSTQDFGVPETPTLTLKNINIEVINK